MAPTDQVQPAGPGPAGNDFFGMMVQRRMAERKRRPQPQPGEPPQPGPAGMPPAAGPMPPPPIRPPVLQAPPGPNMSPPVFQAPPETDRVPTERAASAGGPNGYTMPANFSAQRASRLAAAAQLYGPQATMRAR